MQAMPIYTDFNSLASLPADNGATESEKLDNAARQFSAVFTNMVLKSMRQASLGEGIFDSNQSEMYRDLFDQQIALQLSQGQSLGIAELLVNQFTPAHQKGGQRAVNAYEAVSQWTQETQDLTQSADKHEFTPVDIFSN